MIHMPFLFEGSDKFLHMPITSHRKQLIHIDDKNYFEALIKLNKTYADSMQLQEHQKIEVRILISDKTIGQLLGFWHSLKNKTPGYIHFF